MGKSCIFYFGALTLTLFSSFSFGAQGPCTKYIQKYCQNVKHDRKSTLECLLRRKASLSPACLKKAEQAWNQMSPEMPVNEPAANQTEEPQHESPTVETSYEHITPRSSRKGFYLGFGVGGDYELKESKSLGVAGDIRIGGAVHDQVVLVLNNWGALNFKTESDSSGFVSVDAKIVLTAIQGGALFFLTPGTSSPYIYVGGGLGLAKLTASITAAEALLFGEVDSGWKLGWSVGAAIGYEFRLSPEFCLQPEIAFYAVHASGGTFLPIGGQLTAAWYL